MISSLSGWADFSLLLLRIGVASSFLFHGLQKLAMWKMSPSEQMPVGMLHTLRMLSIVEPIGGILLILGLFTQPIAIIFGVVMVGAILLKIFQMKKKFGEPGGWELDAVLLAGCIPLLVIGGGALGLDHLFF